MTTTYTCQEPGCRGELICGRVVPNDGTYECGHDRLSWRMYCSRCAVVTYEDIERCPHCSGLKVHRDG